MTDNDFIEFINENKDFIMELLKRHPEYDRKVGSGIFELKVKRNRGYHLFILRTDGSEIDVSWKVCISPKNDSIATIQNRMLRFAIREQISNFKSNSDNKCEICGTTEKIEVDHVIPFQELKKQFCKDNILPQRYAEHPTDYVFHKDDKDIELAWKKFHEENAKLQFLCESCHKNKTYNRS